MSEGLWYTQSITRVVQDAFKIRSTRRLAMLDPKVFEELSGRLSALVAASPAADLEKNARVMLSGFFAKLDVVTREEFDIQAKLLLRTREKLQALEARIARLEADREAAD